MAEDAYEGLAERYDRFFGRFGEHDPGTVEFYRRLFAENCVRGVLDCACGTGHDLHLFHTLGCQVHGSDVSDSMLAQARQNLAACGVDVPLQKADYRHLPQHYGQRFDAVMCLSTSIAHMPDDAEVLRALRSMREILRPEGILVLTQGTSDRQWRAKPRFILAADTPEFTRLFVIDYLGRGARYNIVDVDHRDARPALRVHSITYPQMLLRDDYERLLKEAGFAAIEFYGGYAFEPYDKESSARLIVVART